MTTLLPKRRKRERLGVREVVQKVWPRHRRWVKSHGCCVRGCPAHQMRNYVIDFAHLRTAANSGKGNKPHDCFAISLCREHHDEQHRIGPLSFDRKYGIDSWALACQFVSKSPDVKMRESLVLVPIVADGLR